MLPGSEIEVILGIRNDGDANYNGQVGLALLDAEGNGVWSQVKPLMAYGQRTINTTFTVSVPEEEGMYHFMPAYLDSETQATAYFDTSEEIDMTLEVTQEAIADIKPDLVISDVKHVRKNRSELYRFSAVVTNNSSDMVKNFTLNYQMDEGAVKEKKYSQKLRPGESANIYLATSVSTIGKHYFHYSISSIDGLEDTAPENNTGTTTVKVIGTTYDTNVLIEEGTGTWCGYCPRGMVAIDAMRELLGERVIPIAVHSGRDPLVAPSYTVFANANFTSYPSCIVNRNAMGAIDPTTDNLTQACAAAIEAQADADVQIQKAELIASGKKIQAEVAVTIGYNDNKAHYQVGFILVADGVDTDGQGNILQQTNYYAGGTGGPMGGWELRSDSEPWIYDDVARCLYGDSYEGYEGSLPNIISRDEVYIFRKTIDVPENILRKDNLSLVAFVVDMDTHEVMNAQRATIVNGPDGIAALPSPLTTQPSSFYDLQGRRVLSPQPDNIYIDRGKKIIYPHVR